MRTNFSFTRKIVTVGVALCDMEVIDHKDFYAVNISNKTRKLTIGEGSRLLARQLQQSKEIIDLSDDPKYLSEGNAIRWNSWEEWAQDMSVVNKLETSEPWESPNNILPVFVKLHFKKIMGRALRVEYDKTRVVYSYR